MKVKIPAKTAPKEPAAIEALPVYGFALAAVDDAPAGAVVGATGVAAGAEVTRVLPATVPLLTMTGAAAADWDTAATAVEAMTV